MGVGQGVNPPSVWLYAYSFAESADSLISEEGLLIASCAFANLSRAINDRMSLKPWIDKGQLIFFFCTSASYRPFIGRPPRL